MSRTESLGKGVVERTQTNLDVAIYRDWKAGSRFKTVTQLIAALAGGLTTFIILGTITNDIGAQYCATLLFSIGAYIFAQRLNDYFSNHHECGEKLKLNDINVDETDRAILQSTPDLNKINIKNPRLAETLECVECGVFCYIRASSH